MFNPQSKAFAQRTRAKQAEIKLDTINAVRYANDIALKAAGRYRAKMKLVGVKIAGERMQKFRDGIFNSAFARLQNDGFWVPIK